MDGRVIDAPYWLRKFLVQGIILNTRPKKSAAAYKKIWWDEGSPLVVISERLKDKLQAKIDEPVALGMRYGNPSIKAGIEELLSKEAGIKEILLIPLYPHYAMSSYETVVVKAEEIIKAYFPNLKMAVKAPFFDEKNYLKALSDSIKPYIKPDTDHVLFSYHGIPERHVKKSDTTKCHCLKTSHIVAETLGIPRDKYTICFQSRLGPDPWLKPSTTDTLEDMGKKGVKNLVIICPAFVADCLETIEEIGMEGKELFLEAGGESFVMVPCLNDNDSWVNVLAGYIAESKVTPSHV
ncbi:UNVERIFIED_CONTAM: hypothetical protein GTU68_064892 [Idotea baltica]|nr:hypothetical protein [Idotea baltica]